MDELLGLVNVGNVLTLIVAGVVYTPIKQSVDALSRAVERLTDAMDDNKREVNELRERVAKVEGSASSAHKRIDGIESRERRD